MTSKRLLSLILIAILAFGATKIFRVSPSSEQEPYVGVYPRHTISLLPDTYTIEIVINSTVPFIAYQFYLYWDRTHLNATDLSETPPTAWASYFLGSGLKWNHNATHGGIERGVSDTHSPIVAVNGTFTVATITFKVLTPSSPPSDVNLHLDYGNTFLVNVKGSIIVPFFAYDGWILITNAGDVDGDGIVGGLDAGLLGLHWPPQPYYPNCDIDCDGVIGGLDAGIIGYNWGKMYS